MIKVKLMLEFTRKIAVFFLRSSENSEETTTLKERYKQFRISLLVAITIIALLPSTIMAVLGYFQYLDLTQRQSAKHIQWHLQYVSETLLDELNSLKATITKTVMGSSLDLTNGDERLKLLKLLQRKTPDLKRIDLLSRQNESLILSHPWLQSLLQNQEETWFTSLESGNPVLSTIFQDQYKSYYYSLCIKLPADASLKEHYLVASFSELSLQKFLENTNAGAVEDAFLMTKQGELQTESTFFGGVQRQYPHAIDPRKQLLSTTNKRLGMGNILYASIPLPESPWILVLVKDGPIKKREWLTFQMTLILIFITCAIGSFFIIQQLVNLLTIRIRESDTKRMALLNEVGHTNRLATIGKLAAGVAHEINNPLAVIDQKTGLIDDLLELCEDFNHKEKLQSSLTGIHNSVERCKVITHRLLGFARKVDMDKELLSINSVIEEVMGFLEKEALYSHIVFQKDLANELPEIWSDKGQLQQIFLNIISNAIDAIGQNGIITITTSFTIKNKVLVKIEDNGPGIKPDVMEHIFDPFFTTKETGEGTGLGLSITYGLVKKLGGDIKVHSRVHEGVTFYITLPIKSSRTRGDSHE